MKAWLLLAGTVTALAAGVTAYHATRPVWTAAERARIVALSISNLLALPPDPSNRVADSPEAAAFGEALFADLRMSADGTTGCITCHDPATGFVDELVHEVGEGISRRTMPIPGSAYSAWQLWDGRADSQWAQALGPIENVLEHGSDRIAAIRLIATSYPDPYIELFDELPDLDRLPERGSPLADEAARELWARLPEDDRTAVDAVFANLGKAIAAYMRSLPPPRSRFDHYADAMAEGSPSKGLLSDEEIEGLRLFIGRAQCATCHDGPRFTDDAFHNTGVPALEGLPPDLGRVDAVPRAQSDPFNCLGPHSDAGAQDCLELRFVRAGHDMVGAYRTPSLRAVATRAPFMHAGQIDTLEGVIAHYAEAPASLTGHSELESLDLAPDERSVLAAFLRSLNPIEE